MDRVHPAKQARLASDILSARRAASSGTTPKTTRDRIKYWACWKSFATECRFDPFLQNTNDLERELLIQGFAARVRTGVFGRGTKVKVSTVTSALAAISTTIELAGKQSPLYKDKEKQTYTLNIQRMIEGFRRDDPPAIPQLAVPIAVPNLCFEAGLRNGSPKAKAIGSLTLIAFYFLLRVGEYTQPQFAYKNGKKIRSTRTK